MQCAGARRCAAVVYLAQIIFEKNGVPTTNSISSAVNRLSMMARYDLFIYVWDARAVAPRGAGSPVTTLFSYASRVMRILGTLKNGLHYDLQHF